MDEPFDRANLFDHAVLSGSNTRKSTVFHSPTALTYWTAAESLQQ